MKRPGRKRRAPVTLAGGVAMIEIDNPLYQRAHDGAAGNERKIRAAYNPRESFVGFLYFKGKIGDAEKLAGDRIRQAYEAMGGAGAGAIDYTRTRVDGGRIAEPLSERQLSAGQFLKSVRGWLGPAGHEITIRLAGEGCWPRDLAPGDTARQQYYSMRLRECLETCAERLGYATRKRRLA